MCTDVGHHLALPGTTSVGHHLKVSQGRSSADRLRRGRSRGRTAQSIRPVRHILERRNDTLESLDLRQGRLDRFHCVCLCACMYRLHDLITYEDTHWLHNPCCFAFCYGYDRSEAAPPGIQILVDRITLREPKPYPGTCSRGLVNRLPTPTDRAPLVARVEGNESLRFIVGNIWYPPSSLH